MDGTTANERGLKRVNAQPSENTTTNPAIFNQAGDERRRITTLTARLAFKGFSLYELAVGGYLIARHDRTAHAADLRQVQAFLDTLEVQ